MIFGLNEDGFRRKTFNDIISSMEGRAVELFGDNVNLSERGALGQIFQTIAWELSDGWMLAEDIYNSAFVDSADGVPLDNVSKYIAISRKPAQFATGQVTIKGIQGVIVPYGFRVSTDRTQIVFETTESKTIGISGEVVLNIRALKAGEIGNVPAHNIIEIVNPLVGINSVVNLMSTSGGLERESDMELRRRYYLSVSRGGASTRESVQATLLNLPSIDDAFVEENTTMEIVNGIPPKSLAPYVFGGTEQEIAEAIFHTKAGGIQSYGEINVPIVDNNGVTQTIGFSRPTVREIYVKLKITTGAGYVGDNVIKTHVIEHIGGTGEEGQVYSGLRLGEDVVISKIICSAIDTGVVDVSVELSLDGILWNSDNINLEIKEIARTSWDKVLIENVG